MLGLLSKCSRARLCISSSDDVVSAECYRCDVTLFITRLRRPKLMAHTRPGAFGTIDSWKYSWKMKHCSRRNTVQGQTRSWCTAGSGGIISRRCLAATFWRNRQEKAAATRLADLVHGPRRLHKDAVKFFRDRNCIKLLKNMQYTKA